MLHTLPKTYEMPATQRIFGIAVFTSLTIVSARVTVDIGAVPFTLQTLAVFLSGMILGSKDGGLAQLSYISLLAAGLPVDARGLGAAVFTGPTWGYLIAFVPAAYVMGYIVERSGKRYWLRVIAGLIGSSIVFFVGCVVLKFSLDVTWNVAFTEGVWKFVASDFAKVILAAGIAEGMRQLLLRSLLTAEDTID